MAKPQKTVLDNGLTLITQHMPGDQVYANVMVNVGYRNETPEQVSMTHYLEHMGANDSQRLTKQQRANAISNMGGRSNASTNIERTDYWIKADKAHTEEMIQILGDGMVRPLFDDKTVDVERKAVQQELIGKRNNGPRITYEHARAVAFADTQVDKDIIGSVDLIEGHTREKLRALMDLHYTGDNMTLVVVGDVDHEKVREMAEKHFEGLKPSPDGVREPVPYAQYRGGLRTSSSNEAEQVNLTIGFEGSGRRDTENQAIDEIISTILGTGRASRLGKPLKQEKKLVSALDIGNDSLTDNGLFSIAMVTTGDKLPAVIDSVAEELNRLSTTVTQQEIDRARNFILGTLERGAELPEEVGGALALSKTLDGRIYDVQDDMAMLKSITREQVQARIETILSSAPTVAAHGKGVENMPSYEEISAKFGKERHLDERGLTTDSSPAPRPAIPQEKSTKPATAVDNTAPAAAPAAEVAVEQEPRITVLENGLTVVTQRLNSPQLYADVSVKLGHRNETAAQTGISALLSGIANADSEGMTVEQKEHAIMGMRGTNQKRIEGNKLVAGREISSFTLRAGTESADDAVALLAKQVIQPSFSDANVETVSNNLKNLAISCRQDPMYIAGAQLHQVAFPGTQLDKDFLADPKAVSGHGAEALRALKDQYYTADNTVLTVIGNVDHDAIVAMAKSHFAEMKASPDVPRPATPAPVYRGGMKIKSSSEKDQINLQIGFESGGRNDPDTAAVDTVIARMLGGGFASRLMKSLRSDKGLVYYSQALNRTFSDTGVFTILTGTTAPKLAATIDAMAEEVRKFASTATQEELDTAKKQCLGEITNTASDIESLGDKYALQQTIDGVISPENKSRTRIQNVTLEQVQQRAKTLFSGTLSVSAYGKGVEQIPPYEEISEKFGQRRELDASGLVKLDTPATNRSLAGAEIAAQPAREPNRAVG